MNLITPKKLNGFWELMPKEEILFEKLLSKIEETFKQNCFLPLDTPVLEYSEILLAKSNGVSEKEIYRFTKGDTDMCMRYDLTVPLARFVAMHQNDLNFPFKRFQIGKVYRGERPQKGRFREFYQCDADIIGKESLSMIADAECIMLFEKCFRALDLDVEIKVSNRKILGGFIESLKKENVSTEIFIILDKLDKISKDDALAQLQELGLSKTESTKLIDLTKTTGSLEEILTKIETLCESETFKTGIDEIKVLDKHLKNFGAKAYVFDLSVIRGHNYYTGSVFEGFLKNNSERIAIGGGGRYENLCGYFTEKKMPGVGMSVGITRLFELLLEKNYFDLSSQNEIDLAIINFDETLDYCLNLVSKFRDAKINADCFYENQTFKSKMKEANRRQIKYVLIVGEDEINSKTYTLKNMQTSEQEKLTFEEIVEKIKSDRMQTQN